MTTADERLATYGSLGPGRPAPHHVADLRGRWLSGEVHGRLLDEGWGADLPPHWALLDDFEGPGYERVVTTVHTADGDLEACTYVARSRGNP